MNNLDNILGRIPNVKQIKQNQWVACCVAHKDRSPSLYISAADDGRVLLHCFAGCSADDITAAIGLTLADLFPDTTPQHYGQLPDWKRRQYQGLLQCERLVIEMAKTAREKGKQLSPKDADRYQDAIKNARKLEGLLNG